MRSEFRQLLVAAALICGVAQLAAAESPWKLCWSDEFNGDSIDKTKWTFDEGNGFGIPGTNIFVSGWGNDELEYYTSRPRNSYVKDGLLHIRAIHEPYQGLSYTSAKMLTRKLFTKKYGRFEFRAKLPLGQGIWPAIWMLPAGNVYGTWPSSGEIDIVEARGQDSTKVLGTLHFGSSGTGHDWQEDDFTFPAKQTTNDFHVYALEWEPGVMRYYVDDKLYATKRRWWSSSHDAIGGKDKQPPADQINPWPAPFDQPFYIVFNLAVGGRFLGNPDATTVFPQELLIDYVRVYDKIGGYSAPAAEVQGDTR